MFSEFLDQQRDSYNEVIREGKELFKKYCEADTSFLKKKKDLWNFLEKKESIVPSQNPFTGFFPVGYGPHKFLSIRSHKFLADMSSCEEEKLQDDILYEGDIGEGKMFPEEFCDSGNANDIDLKKEESFRKKNNWE